VYSTRAEALIAQRRQMLKDRVEGRGPRVEEAQTPTPEAEPRSERDEEQANADDPLERFAQNSVSALERFGAELEAMFTGAPVNSRSRDQAPTAATKRDEARSTLDPRPSNLALLDTELARQLMEEGIVVRGHDVARVVGLMVGQGIKWDE
jgi:hypothetical protein